MKKIKSFKLFEADEVDTYAEMCEVFDDIKSIEYIVEEAGYDITYKFMFKKNKHDRYSTDIPERSVSSMIENNPDLVKKQYGKFIGFTIEVAHPKDEVIVNDGGQIRLTPEQIEKLGSDCERYCKMLKDHLNYVSSVKRHSGKTGKNIVVVKL